MRSWLATKHATQPASRDLDRPNEPQTHPVSHSDGGPILPALRHVRILENPQHPVIALFEGRAFATEAANVLGAPWVPVGYACGYILTDGWAFRDANGIVPTFCPVPPDALPIIQDLVRELQHTKASGHDMAQRIGQELRQLPVFKALDKVHFTTACTCTLMRVCHPEPVGAKNDWLNMPAWALKLPSRRRRLN